MGARLVHSPVELCGQLRACAAGTEVQTAPQENPYREKLKDRHCSFLTGPPSLMVVGVVLSPQEIKFRVWLFQVLLVDGNGLLHPRGRTVLESPALQGPPLPLEFPVLQCPAVTVTCCWQDLGWPVTSES